MMITRRAQVGNMGTVVAYFSDSDVTNKRASNWNKPVYYDGRDGPRFIVVDYSAAYDIRHYPEAFWVCTRTGHGVSRKDAMMKLRRYFKGENSTKDVMSLPCPLLVKHDVTPPSDDEGTLCLVLPADKLKDPPSPLDQSVFLRQEPSRLFFVAKIPGIVPKQEEWERRQEKFIERLRDRGENFNAEFVYNANYRVSGGGKPYGKYHEVWAQGRVITKDFTAR